MKFAFEEPGLHPGFTAQSAMGRGSCVAVRWSTQNACTWAATSSGWERSHPQRTSVSSAASNAVRSARVL